MKNHWLDKDTTEYWLDKDTTEYTLSVDGVKFSVTADKAAFEAVASYAIRKEMEQEFQDRLQEHIERMTDDKERIRQEYEMKIEEVYQEIQEEYSQSMEEAFDEAYEAILKERKKNEMLEVELYEQFDEKLKMQKEWMADTVDKYLDKMAAQLGIERLVKEKTGRDIVDEVTGEKTNPEETLKAQVKNLEKQVVRLQAQLLASTHPLIASGVSRYKKKKC